MIGVFIALFWGGIIYVCISKIHKSNIKNKRLFRVIVYIVVAILWTASSSAIVNNIGGSFSSPEDVVKYMAFKKVEEVVYGKETALVLWREDNTAYSNVIVEKEDNRWKITNEEDTEIVYHNTTSEFDIIVYRYKTTEEYYIRIFSYNGIDLKIEDNKNSLFKKIKCEAEVSNLSKFVIDNIGKNIIDLDSVNTTFYYYYGYVETMDESYIINIDDFEVVPMKD